MFYQCDTERSTIKQHSVQNVCVVKPSLFASQRMSRVRRCSVKSQTLSLREYPARNMHFAACHRERKWVHITSSVCMLRFQPVTQMQRLDRRAAFGIYLKFCVVINYCVFVCRLHSEEDTSLVDLSDAFRMIRTWCIASQRLLQRDE